MSDFPAVTPEPSEDPAGCAECGDWINIGDCRNTTDESHYWRNRDNCDTSVCDEFTCKPGRIIEIFLPIQPCDYHIIVHGFEGLKSQRNCKLAGSCIG